MSLFLNTNVSSLNAQRHFRGVTGQLNKSIERLSSGIKLNRASDGAGSLLLANSLEAQRRGMDVAANNIQQGINVLNIADSALQTVQGDLQRLREIAIEAANPTVTDFTGHSAEVGQIFANIDAISNGTSFGTGAGAIQLLDGSVAAFAIQAGAGTAGSDTIDISGAFADTDAAALGLLQNTLASNANATTLLGEVDAALTALSGFVATIGGNQSQLENRLDYVQISSENLSASEGIVKNVDVAVETARLTQLQILQQASALALSQANQAPSIALRLLQ